jgi:hypothetical protein
MGGLLVGGLLLKTVGWRVLAVSGTTATFLWALLELLEFFLGTSELEPSS